MPSTWVRGCARRCAASLANRRFAPPENAQCAPAWSHSLKLVQRLFSLHVAAQARPHRDEPAGPAPAGPGAGVENAVDDQRADPTWEQVGVRLSQDRPVGEAQVGQLAIPERCSQQVHVAGDVLGGHVPQNRAAVACAGSRELGHVRLLDPLLACGDGKDGGGQRVYRLFLRLVTEQWGALQHPAWVEPDDVEAGAQRRRQVLADAADQVDARSTWSTRVHDERPDPLTRCGRPKADRGEGDRGPGRGVVVQRDRDGGALEPLTAR